jgi:hypothetical protein
MNELKNVTYPTFCSGAWHHSPWERRTMMLLLLLQGHFEFQILGVARIPLRMSYPREKVTKIM